ncbi:hypothetical protein Dimus_009195 [Dionaea muscipula]
MENKGEETRRYQPRCRHRRRVVLVVMPIQGHINPMMELAKILHSRGFPITIAHPEFNSPNPTSHPEFDYLLFEGFSASNGAWDAAGTDFDFARMADLISSINSRCREPFQRSMEALRKEEEEEGGGIGCIIYDQYMFFAQAVASHLNLKGFGLRTGAAVTLMAFTVRRCMDQLHSTPFPVPVGGGEELDGSGIEDVLKALEPLRPASYAEIRSAVNQAFTNSTGIIVNTVEFLESQAIKTAQHYYFPTPIVPIGPFHKISRKNSPNSLVKEDSSCISWLDKHQPNSVLYVSFGSIASISAAEFVEIAWGLEASKQPFLWVIRSGLIHGGDDWRKLLPRNNLELIDERSCFVSWAPQKQVLAHPAVGGFWSHCGWNSTLESICEGVPVICRPFFGDQFANTMYITGVWKVGLELKDNQFERSEIERCIRRLMEEKEGEEMRSRAGILKEKAVSMSESTEKHLSWLEVHGLLSTITRQVLMDTEVASIAEMRDAP